MSVSGPGARGPADLGTGRFRGRATFDPRMDVGQVLLAVSGLYLLVVVGRLVARLLGYARVQSWELVDDVWVCQERTTMLGTVLATRTLRVPTSSIVHRSTGSLGDPALLLCGAIWLFFLVLWGVTQIHTGLITGTPLRIFSGALLVLAGLAVDVGCFLLHQKLAARHALQFGLLDGSVLTIRDPDPPTAGE